MPRQGPYCPVSTMFSFFCIVSPQLQIIFLATTRCRATNFFYFGRLCSSRWQLLMHKKNFPSITVWILKPDFILSGVTAVRVVFRGESNTLRFESFLPIANVSDIRHFNPEMIDPAWQAVLRNFMHRKIQRRLL